MVDINDLFRQAILSQQQPMGGMAQPQSDNYTPTSGAQMEADSRSSADSAMDRLLSMQERNHQNDRNMQWMSFFGKLAASKSPTLLGSLGEGANALAETTGKQQQNNQLLEQAALGDQLKYEEWKKEDTRKDIAAGPENALKEAQAKYYDTGGAQSNRIIPVVGPDGETQYVKAGDALTGGYKPVANYNNMNVTLSPEAIDASADALHKGASPASITGFGSAANRTAILNHFSQKYPGENLGDAQIAMAGDKAGARKIGAAGGQIELASQSLKSMIPLAKEAADKMDTTNYPSINAMKNAVAKGTGDKNIVTLNTYLNAVMADHAALLVRTGTSTDAARQKAYDMANAAMSKGQLGAYFDAVNNEIGAQESAVKEAKRVTYGGGSKSSSSPSPANTAGMVHEGWPDVSKYSGKVITDQDTGQKYKSDGTNWNPI